MRGIIALLILIPVLASAGVEQYLVLCHQELVEAGEEGEYDPAYCRRAAELGSPEAHYVMGSYYSRKADRKQAKIHYQAAADSGFVWGHIGLGHSLAIEDPETAEIHYRAVAESDDEAAIMGLAFIGDLRVREEAFPKAYSWFYACAYFETHAQDFCRRKLETVESKLNSKQIEQAAQAAQSIIDRYSHNKGFNRTPESSGPAKPGEFGGGAG